MSWFAAKLVLVKVGAAQEGHAIENMLLKPLQPEINHRSDVKREKLRNDKAADNNETEWAP